MLLLGVLSLGLLGCDPVRGTLEVFKEFSIKNNEKCEWTEREPFKCDRYVKGKKFKIKAGSHRMELASKGKRKFEMKIKMDGKSKVLPLTLPKGHDIPKYSGDFSVPGRAMKQDFDLNGVVDTEVTESDIHYGSESCTYTEREWVCKPRKGRRRGKGNREPRCDYEYVTYHGSQDVEYYYRYTDTELTMNFENGETLATFHGTRHESDKIYTYQGECY